MSQLPFFCSSSNFFFCILQGAATKVAKVEAGSSVGVFGLGAVGLSVVQGAVFNKAGRIIGIDVNPRKEKIARELGITDFVNSSDYDKPIQQV